MSTSFEIRLSGILSDLDVEAGPESLSIGRLLAVLAPLERSIRLMSDELGRPPTPRATLTLLAHGAGSSVLTLAVHEADLEAAATVTEALATGCCDHLSSTAHRELHHLSRSVLGLGLALEIEPSPGSGLHRAAVTAERPVSPPGRPTAIRELTTIYGKLLMVGGAGPTKHASLKLQNGDPLRKVRLNEALARELAPRLFEVVGLSGLATWELTLSRILEFEVHEVLPYRYTDPATAIQHLREVVGDAFDDIADPLAWQRELRGKAPA